MAESGKAGELIERAQRFGLRLEYRSDFLIATWPTSTDRQREDLAEMEQPMFESLGKRLEEVRARVVAEARAARGKELVGNRVLIPLVGVSHTRDDAHVGRVLRSQISGKLVALNGDGQLTVSHLEARDDNRLEHRTTCDFDEAFVIVGSGDQPDRGSSFALVSSEKIKRGLERGQAIGLTLELETGIVIANWNVAPGDQEAAEEILRELGPPRGELFNFLEGRARGAAGSDFVGKRCFVVDFDAFGTIESCDATGAVTVRYRDKWRGSELTCYCNGDRLLIIVGEEAARDGSASPSSAAPKNWLRRAFGS